ncbi:hypothetical protein C8J57DRAFT_1233079 [Mycena rebaudengoi]|nr:hypothetical protein C8J57DRAFT_1233079 [Mycena rebaudengoi]
MEVHRATIEPVVKFVVWFGGLQGTSTRIARRATADKSGGGCKTRRKGTMEVHRATIEPVVKFVVWLGGLQGASKRVARRATTDKKPHRPPSHHRTRRKGAMEVHRATIEPVVKFVVWFGGLQGTSTRIARRATADKSGGGCKTRRKGTMEVHRATIEPVVKFVVWLGGLQGASKRVARRATTDKSRGGGNSKRNTPSMSVVEVAKRKRQLGSSDMMVEVNRVTGVTTPQHLF